MQWSNDWCLVILQVDVNSVFGEEENKFLFNNVVVGRKAKARFKLSNSQKVPCDVTLSIKPIQAKYSSKTVECFDVEHPLKLQIPAHSHTYATILFTPQGTNHPLLYMFPESWKRATPNV